MFYKHNELPCGREDSLHVAFQRVRQLDSGDHSGHFPDGTRPRSSLEFGKMESVPSNHNSGCAFAETSNFSLFMSSKGDIKRSENNIKRSFDDGENFQAAAKRTRQMDGNLPATRSICEGSFVASDDKFNRRKDDAIHGSTNDCYGRSFSFRWVTSSTSEDTPPESPVRLSFYPGYYEDCWRSSRHSGVEECQSPVFDSLPRKPVAIGPDHQADVPIWRPKSSKSCHQGDCADDTGSCGQILTDEGNCEKWTRHCVMPMPDSSYLVEPLGHLKSNCCCLDQGSIRCVRQHVKEARDKLRSSLGHERFVELGLHDMGETVALGWTEEEQRLFSEVVAYNPASSGKNFWETFPLAFPSRSNKELVSYYFNVFMLRKRAEQNRCDPSDVDSDNDEWQYSEDEEDDESGVESPADAAAELGRVHGDEEIDGHEEADEDCYDDKSKFGPSIQPVGVSSHGYTTGEDQDVHDDSCTSFEGPRNGVDVYEGDVDVLEGLRDSLGEEGDHGEFCGMSSLTTMDHIDDDLMIGHCDPKPWELGYLYGLDKDLELLPTCNVIEEVFGNES